MPFLVLLLLAVLSASCRGGERAPASEDRSGPDAAPAVYERRLVFLASDRDSPLGAVMDFVVAAGGRELHRSARGWLRENDEWREFLDISWRMEPMRDPWRVVPHGPLRLVVGEDDDIEALVHRAAPALRLMPGADVAGSVPHSGGQLRLRRSRLRVEGREYSGILLDAQFVQRTGTAAPAPLPTGEEIFLTDGRGMYFVIAGNGGAESFAWLQRGQDERIWNDATVERQESDAADEAAPGTWRVFAREGGFHGELEPIDGHVAPAGSEASVPSGTIAVFVVSGWLDVMGERRQVSGILRHARE